MWEEDILKNLKFGIVDLLILKLLTKEDMYGYKIKQEIYKLTDSAIDIKEGSLYGPFYRLEKKDLIKAYKVLVGQKRFRIYYKLTMAGKKYLENGLKIFQAVYGGAAKIFSLA